jgi:hypothetical protein
MAIDVSALTEAMKAAGITAFGNSWSNVEKFAVPEFQKIAIQIAAIETGGFSPEVAKKLLEMQVESAEDVLIALVDMTIFEVQQAINAVLKAIAGVVNAQLHFPLL